jgi:hypothetical protein
MRMTALREGEQLTDDVWSFTAAGAPRLNVPTIQVLFTHDLSSLTVFAALMSGPDDDDPDDDV